ncbi:MAG: HD domain-containing protein [Dehalococcoidia bacterium]|nr:HD domain-containing protein [Dehalococcoidia bacterium]
MKLVHEIRDPIHAFIKFDSEERQVLDSEPVQRLRHIHQLAMGYLVYPGATHRRFEHSLGVMELAGRVYDVITAEQNVRPEIKQRFPELNDKMKLDYWRRVVRLAGLCHDIGHLPFSHAAEKEKDLLPDGWSHEKLSALLIEDSEIKTICEQMTPLVRTEDVAKLAVGQKELKDRKFTDWEALLSEIIVGNAFGVDRMDYLLRDSHHAGVAYGRFDHFRLIDTMRILPMPVPDDASPEPQLGVEEGGLHSAEALSLARYFMFTQVYFHHIRRIYDIHLQDFLKEWLPLGQFPIDAVGHLSRSDLEVSTAIAEAARNEETKGHVHARRIVKRDHFRVLWQRNPEDLTTNPDAGKCISDAAATKFGTDNVRRDSHAQPGATIDFPVERRDGNVTSAQAISDVLPHIPSAAVDNVFVRRDLLDDAEGWLSKEKVEVIRPRLGDQDEEAENAG